MPTTIEEVDTMVLVGQLDNMSAIYTVAEIKAELQAREVDNEYPDEEMRGGIHPRRPL